MSIKKLLPAVPQEGERQQPFVADVRFGSKADIEALHPMSALPPKADIY